MNHSKKCRNKKSHRTHHHDDEIWISGLKDGEQENRKDFEMGDHQWLDVNFNEKVDFLDGGLAICLSTTPRSLHHCCCQTMMLPVVSGSALEVAISSSCHDTVAPSSVVGRFLLQAECLELAARLSL